MAVTRSPRPAAAISTDLLQHRRWEEAMVEDAGIPVVEAPFLSVGGGLGSFAVIDFLRIAGVKASDLWVLSNLRVPWQTFESLARVSQIRPEDRLRSDSASRIDNIWGWPSYALAEAFSERNPLPLLRVLLEPLICEYFTPRLGTVIGSLAREANRIGWAEMLIPGWAEVVRIREGGGYFVLGRSLGGGGPELVAYRCAYVHLAVGYPSPRLLPDMLRFRATCRDSRRMVNAYEPHEEVYEELNRRPGRVILRGSGITASQILQRLIDDRDHAKAQTEIVHLFRNYVAGATGPVWDRRPGGHGFAYQHFNFPKSAGSGQLRARMLSLSGEERSTLIQRMGGTSTPRRGRWQRQLERGRRQGWYRPQKGCLESIAPTGDGRLEASIRCNGEARREEIDFVIDATGLEDDFTLNPLLADLLRHGGAGTNPLGRLDVDPSFEVRGTRSGFGRLYASGAATLGCPVAPVDSFFGLTQAALEICDDLADQGVCEVPGPLQSLTQWWRWVKNRRP